jgi:2-polyprenyl-3-methyl-5-hydroxy-6-metoxy-1,4-benzoquinol methylase
LCGFEKTKKIFTEKIHNEKHEMDFNIVKCSKCGFVYVNPIDTDYTFSVYRSDMQGPDAEQLYYDQFEQKKQINELMLNMLTARLSKDAKILDIGCGTGALLIHLKNDFYNLFGVDTSKREVAYAQSLGLNVAEGNANSVDSCFVERFDAIIMSDVLEHIEDPSLVLSKCHKLLRTKGLLLLRIPNGKFQINKAKLRALLKGKQARKPEMSVIGSGEHLSHFSINTITKILESNGFRNIEISTSPIEFCKNNAINLIKRFYNPMSTAIYKTLNIMVNNAIVLRCEK